VFALLGVAMHLSIQRHAHAQAEVLVQAWGKQAHVQIGAVRYHILRNGLILKNIHIQRGADVINIEHLLIRTNPALLNDPVLHVGAVEISGISAELHIPPPQQPDPQQRNSAQANQVWQHDPQLMKLWQAVTSFKAQHGQLTLYLPQFLPTHPVLPAHSDEPAQSSLSQATPTPLIINNIALSLSTQNQQRTLLATGLVHEGRVQWQQTSNSLDHTSKGHVSWQHVSTSALSDALAFNSIAGHLQGKLNWQQPELSGQDSFSIQANMQFHALAANTHNSKNNTAASNTDTDSDTALPRLQFTAIEQNQLWSIDMHALAWPLSPWSSIIPHIAQHQLLAGQLNGVSHWQEKPEGWIIQGEAGGLRNILFAATNTTEQTWAWRDIDYDSFHINSMQHRLHVSQVQLNDGNISFRTAITDGQFSDEQKVSSNTVHATPPNASKAAASKETPYWSISADHIQATNMALSLALPEGELSLKSLHVEASWPQNKALAFNINTQAAKNDPTLEQWQIRGNMSRPDTSQNSHAEFAMRAQHAPLNRLRLLLALQDDANSPITLAGTVDLNSRISVHQHMWTMQGKATAYDVQISHAGNIWASQQIEAQFGPIGMGLETQEISLLQAKNWSYIATLEPLQAIPINTPEPAPIPYKPPWWAAALNKQHIQIQHLQLNAGTLSIGHKESIWASNIDIQIDHLIAHDWAAIDITADVSDGDFTLNGQWDALSEPQRFQGSISLHAATPFFLHEWMSASDMPRLLRGRLNASLNIKHEAQTDRYQSDWHMQLRNAMTETGLFNNDPMLTRSGLNTEYLLNRLSQLSSDNSSDRSSGHNQAIQLHGQVNGSWQEQALTINKLGESLQTALREAASTAPKSSPALKPARIATHIRLHERKPLSLNERSRLFRIIRQLHNKPEMTVELKPLWSGDTLNNDVLARIQHTQNLIERFLRHRNITRQRIFPRWPSASDHDDEISSIQINLSN